MKISSASKKVLASALSAAMVVAFAPTVAFGAVIEDNGGSTAEEQPAVSGETVATVSYFAKKTDTGVTSKFTEEFKATDEASYDNAVQAALIYANNIAAEKGYTLQSGAKYPVTVQLQKDVTVDAVYGTNKSDDNKTTNFAKSVWNANTDKDDNYTADASKVVESSSALVVDGTVTIDLNGHKLSNNANAAAKGEANETGVITAGDQSVFSDGLRTIGETKTKTVYIEKSLADSCNANQLKAVLAPGNTTLTKYTKKAGSYYVSGMDENGQDAYTAVATGDDTTNMKLFYGYDISYKTATSYKAGRGEQGGTVTITDSKGGGSIVATNANAVDTRSAKSANKTHDLVLGNVVIEATGDIETLYTATDSIPADKKVGDVASYKWGAMGVRASKVDIQGAATVTAKSKKQAKAVFGTEVTVGDAENKLEGVSLTATAEATEAEDNDFAAAIAADSYTAYDKAQVTATATANGRGASSSTKPGSTVDTGTGSTGSTTGGTVGDATSTTGTAAAQNVHSFAVKAENVNIEAGKYSAEYAVAKDSESKVTAGKDNKFGTKDDVWTYTNDNGANGSIKYGEFEGHVYGDITQAAKAAANDLTINGGVYSENPDATAYTYKVAGEAVTSYWSNKMGDNMGVATDGSKYYAFKKASLNAANYDSKAGAYYDNKSSYNNGQGTDATNSYIAVSDTDAYTAAIAKGEKASGIKEWADSAVESLALGKSVSGVSVSGDASAIQGKLINGNYGDAERTVVLTVAPKRVDEAVAAEAEASKSLIDAVKATAKDEGASVQGFYTVAASLSQGYSKYADATNSTAAAKADATSIATVSSLGDTKVKVTVRPVSLNSGAKALTAEGTATELSTKQAVTNNVTGDAWMETSSLAPFGVTYGSNVVSQTELAKLMEQIQELQKKLGLTLDGTVDTTENLKAQLAKLQDKDAVSQVKGATKTVKAKAAKKKAQTVKLKAVKSDSGNKASFKKASGNKKVTVSKSGTVKLAKGVKKGAYTAKVKATVGKATKTVSVKFIVK